jgi:nucleoid-associated protein YgaU
VAGGEKDMPNGENFETGIEPPRNTLAAIAAGVLVVIAGFLVYNYFSRVGNSTEPEITEEAALFEEGEVSIPEPEEIGGEEEFNTEQNETNQEATTTENEESLPEEGTVAGVWTARDLIPNSVSDDSYTVQSGDTLWEIAEARYGSGFEWGKILEANKDKIGFLPNGSQALIEVGQTLVLPN